MAKDDTTHDFWQSVSGLTVFSSCKLYNLVNASNGTHDMNIVHMVGDHDYTY